MIKSIYRFISPKFQNLFLEYKVDFKPRYGHGSPAHNGLFNIVNKNRDYYKSFLKKVQKYQSQLHQIKKTGETTNVIDPSWNNGYLPGLDIIGIYTMIAEMKPFTYVEVGSGFSTKVANKAIIDNGLTTEIISIDPNPRSEIKNIATKIINKPFENIDFEFLFELKENDILFIDNSHRILPNSDSMVFYLEVLPKIPKGVIVHIHDIYIPYDYPQFMCDRFYSEQYGLAMFLLANPDKYFTLLPNYFISEDESLSKEIEWFWDHPNLKDVEKHGGSFWLRIK